MQQLALGKRVAMLPQMLAGARSTVSASAGERPSPGGSKRSRHSFPAGPKPERHHLGSSGGSGSSGAGGAGAPGGSSGTSTLASAAAGMALEGAAPAEEEARGVTVLSRFRALVLDASYRPMAVVNWQRAILMDLLEKADVLEYYSETVCSVRDSFFLPAVMRARRYRRAGGRPQRVPLNRRNVLVRDDFRCQYCGAWERELTLDHVLPTSRGGANTWENLVTACAGCNSKKGSKSLKELRWKLRAEPREPSPYELSATLTLALERSASLPPEWEAWVQPVPEHVVARRAGPGAGQQ